MTTVEWQSVPFGWNFGTLTLSERRARHAAPFNASAATAAWYERRRQYRDLLRKKRENFWQLTVEADRSSLQQLWRSIDQLIG